MTDQTTDIPVDLDVTTEGQGTTRRRERMGDALGRTASKLHQKAGEAEGQFSRALDGAANALDSTGRYLREFDGRETMNQVADYARRNPGKSLLAAAVVGYFVGRSFSRSDHT